ncbi:hypothetical protein IPM62_01365 [Candidatus Woesebacteria bacterium]|nr:MAG: hypothetical protein IPM62_01365 [Candidatus Woesebacteria bacterium]
MQNTEVLEKCYKDIARIMLEKVEEGWNKAWIEADYIMSPQGDVDSFIARQSKENENKLHGLRVDFGTNSPLKIALNKIHTIVIDNNGNRCKWFKFKLTPDGSFNINFDYDNNHSFTGR